MEVKEKENSTLSNIPEEPKITIRTDVGTINKENYHHGNSVNKHKDLEYANELLGSDEIHQQNENL
ncbi:hypothetical protein H1Z61_04900 [Bacillus aquiflavi]|uniref:Uncharacterized protein n=1 Tax=Bacillus aquiflavi TaxID=2672567 RepID=A0A6B3VUF8_9BACI|nr:hypothetical protein [Bacillus aquiflavi]NEY80868.1 hypothetical protein [Bacillus aquiflavi]